jgi:hypothetical protein
MVFAMLQRVGGTGDAIQAAVKHMGTYYFGTHSEGGTPTTPIHR